MLKYKQKISEHMDNITDQLEKVISWVQYDRLTKEENTKMVGDVVERLNQVKDLIDLEEGY